MSEIRPNDRFGRLVTVERFTKLHASGKPRSHWVCRCDCGKEKSVSASNLKSQNTTSCGCFSRELTSARNFKHGNAKRNNHSGAYATWRTMLQRCGDPTSTAYHYYGGRGIKVCKRWMKFENFLLDMGERPLGKSIDRKNNALGYSKRNCKWSTRSEQRRNQPRYINKHK